MVRVLGQPAFLAMVAASDLVAAEIGQLLRKRMAFARLRQAAPHLAAEAGGRLLPEFTARTYRAGETIIRQGEAADAFFVVVTGEVIVSRLDAAGQDQPAARLGPGEYFGEVGLLHAAPRNATVSAAEAGDVETLVADRDGFTRLLDASGGMTGELARAMLDRVERLTP